MNVQDLQPATPETVWAILQEIGQLHKEAKQLQKETIEMHKANEKKWEELTKSQEETIQMHKATDKKWDNLSKQLGGMANSQGDFAEEYFYNSFEKGETDFFGEKFDEIEKNVRNHWQGLKDEYDIVLYNHAAVAIIEVKYKARIENLPKVLKKAETFRILFPQYKDFKIYLGLAGMSFEANLEEECIKEGIAVIKQVGDKVVINDTNLKVF